MGEIVVLSAACSTSNPTSDPVGAVCSSGASCASGSCWHPGPNDSNVSGLCTRACVSSTDCGAAAYCLQGIGAGGQCVQTCRAASDCASGVPCTWATVTNGGLCLPTPSNLCSIGGQGSCLPCFDAQCCDQLKACFDDLTCGQIALSSCGDATCTGALRAGDTRASTGAADPRRPAVRPRRSRLPESPPAALPSPASKPAVFSLTVAELRSLSLR